MVISTSCTVICDTQLASFLSRKGPCQPFVFQCSDEFVSVTSVVPSLFVFFVLTDVVRRAILAPLVYSTTCVCVCVCVRHVRMQGIRGVSSCVLKYGLPFNAEWASQILSAVAWLQVAMLSGYSPAEAM